MKAQMARNEKLEATVREALAEVPHVEEKQMFRGTAFMINGKLCISAGDAELMFRFDPARHGELAQQDGCREMLRNGKPIKGYLYVHESGLKSKKDLNYWITLALDYNQYAKATRRKTKA
jgi:TfoX/Sxy family transcriptional regulator of competence genes